MYKEKTVEIDGVIISMLGGFTFVLGFWLVFRVQQGYARWWEAVTLRANLRGEWFNAANALLAFCSLKREQRQEVLEFKHKVVRLFSLLHLSALEAVSSRPDLQLECLDLDGFDRISLEFMAETHDRVEVILHWIQQLVYRADIDGTLEVASPLLNQIYSTLAAGNVTFNDARKIAVYPIPFPFAQVVTVMLWAHWLQALLWRHKVSTVICPPRQNSANSVYKYIFADIYGHIYIYGHL